MKPGGPRDRSVGRGHDRLPLGRGRAPRVAGARRRSPTPSLGEGVSSARPTLPLHPTSSRCCGFVAIVGAPECRQVHPAQPADRGEAVDRLAEGADHAVPRAGHPDARRQPGAAGGHARHLPPAPAAGPRDGGGGLDRRAGRRPRAAAGGRQDRRDRGGARHCREAGRGGTALLAGAEQDRSGAAGSVCCR